MSFEEKAREGEGEREGGGGGGGRRKRRRKLGFPGEIFQVTYSIGVSGFNHS